MFFTPVFCHVRSANPGAPIVSPTLPFIDLDSDLGITESGGVVSAWADQSTSANHFTQATVGARPTIVAAQLNGKPAIRFDGTDDTLACSAFTAVGACTFIGVFKRNAAGSVQEILDVNNLFQIDSTITNQWRAWWNNRGAATTSAGAVTTPVSFVAAFSGTQFRFYINGVLLINQTIFSSKTFTTVQLATSVSGFGSVDWFALKGWNSLRSDAEFAADEATMRAIYAL